MRICLDGRMGAEGSVLALGMFDGVHVGHSVLLQTARVVAKLNGVPMVVQTFAQHPLSLLDPANSPPLLTTLEERAALIARAGADVFSATPFTPTVRDTPPEVFVGELVRQWKPKAVVVGFNYSFGSHGEGTPALMRHLGHALGFHTYVVPGVRISGRPVSSSAIRALLLAGNVQQARFFLGRAYHFQVTQLPGLGVRRSFAMADAEKLRLPPGLYRAVLEAEGRGSLIMARVGRDGCFACKLPTEGIPGHRETVKMLTEWPL